MSPPQSTHICENAPFQNLIHQTRRPPASASRFRTPKSRWQGTEYHERFGALGLFALKSNTEFVTGSEHVLPVYGVECELFKEHEIQHVAEDVRVRREKRSGGGVVVVVGVTRQSQVG
jgi:hypothetical protein